MSGVKVDQQSLAAYNKLKAHSLKYIIFGIDTSSMSIVPLSEAGAEGRTNEQVFEAFLEELPAEDCRYAVFDFEWEKEGGAGQRAKICFFSWCVFRLSLYLRYSLRCAVRARGRWLCVARRVPVCIGSRS